MEEAFMLTSHKRNAYTASWVNDDRDDGNLFRLEIQTLVFAFFYQVLQYIKKLDSSSHTDIGITITSAINRSCLNMVGQVTAD